MKEWGWTNPVLADEAGGVIVGHARLLAARQLGIAEVPGDLLADRTQGLTDPDDAPEAPEHPVSRTGDLWLLGRHRLLWAVSVFCSIVATSAAPATSPVAAREVRGNGRDAPCARS
jgi:hypothetical protein